MNMSLRLRLSITCAAILMTPAVGCSDVAQPYLEAVRRADKVILYEGLPHPSYEKEVLAEEKKNKSVRELHGQPFYEAPLDLSAEVAKQLRELLGHAATYEPFEGEKKCGGFHPDYAVEFTLGADRYLAQICFGCKEVKLFGPNVKTRHDLSKGPCEKLKKLLENYRKNRPPA